MDAFIKWLIIYFLKYINIFLFKMLKLRVYDLMERLTQNFMGPSIRYIGKSVLSAGVKL